jgi:hypothetical protein
MYCRSYRARLLLGCLLGMTVAGCGRHSDKPTDAPTVDAFTGRLTHNGEPVNFPEGTTVRLNLVRVSVADNWGIPIAADGTFDIGWMPIGKYSGQLLTTKPSTDNERGGGAPSIYTIPQFEIVEGQTEYAIELGANWKP